MFLLAQLCFWEGLGCLGLFAELEALKLSIIVNANESWHPEPPGALNNCKRLRAPPRQPGRPQDRKGQERRKEVSQKNGRKGSGVKGGGVGGGVEGARRFSAGSRGEFWVLNTGGFRAIVNYPPVSDVRVLRMVANQGLKLGMVRGLEG